MTTVNSEAKAIAALYCSRQTELRKNRIKTGFLFALMDAGVLLRGCSKWTATGGAAPVVADYLAALYAVSGIFLTASAVAVTLLSLYFLWECVRLGRVLRLYGAGRALLWALCLRAVSFFYRPGAVVTLAAVLLTCVVPVLRGNALFYTILCLLTPLSAAWLADAVFLWGLMGISR